MMIAQQQQQQQYLDYFYFGNNGSGAGENNIENEDHININIHNNNDNAAISSNSVNNNNIGMNAGNAATNEMDMKVTQSMFSLNAQQQEDDVKPLIDLFDVTNALAIGDEEEVGEITSKAADLDLGSYHCRSELVLRHNFHSVLNVTRVLLLKAI
ncbi:uncharacterized protein A4U43_C08F4790 [Asparagus officinalis]|nr:uncharacterized protein A4U43_C08F4790 [Asparagus officinalis]